MPVTDLTVVSK